MCESFDDTSQKMDNGIAGEKISSLTGVILLIYNTDRDNQLNTDDSFKSLEAINLNQTFFKLHNKTIKLSCITHHKIQGTCSPQTIACTVIFVTETFQITNCL